MARIAMIATVPIAIATCWLRSRPTPTIPPEVWRTPDAISLRSTMLNSVLMCRAEQAGRPHNQHADDNEEGDGQFELTSDYGNIGAGKVFYDTDGKSSEDRPAGARQPAQHNARPALFLAISPFDHCCLASRRPPLPRSATYPRTARSRAHLHRPPCSCCSAPQIRCEQII